MPVRLGFDTATEVSLLGKSAAQASHGLAFTSVLIFPALFARGMSLVDAADGMMAGAYRWALARPGRRRTYSLAITLASVVVAVVIGGIDALGLLADRFGLGGTVWRAVGALDGHFTALGVSAVVLFAACWGWRRCSANGRTKRSSAALAPARCPISGVGRGACSSRTWSPCPCRTPS